MNVSRRPMRYSHTDGHTDLCYTADGKYIITCGNDGDVRVWCGLEDDDPSSHCVGEIAFAVCYKGKHLFVATDNNTVQTYTFPELEKDGVISSFVAPVTHIVISNDGKKIISGSRDMTIQICEKSSGNYDSLVGHAAPILGVSLDPEMKFLASSSCDGTVRIWSLDTLKCEHIWSCLPVTNSFTSAKCLGRTSWHPTSGKYIAVPDNTNIDLYLKDTWEKRKSFSDENVKKPFSIARFSPCGQYLAGSTTCGEICLWDFKTSACLSYTEHPRNHAITAMEWNPANDGTIAFCDVTGQFGTIEGCVASKEKEAEDTDDFPKILAIDDDDDDNENVISLEKIKSSVSLPVLPEMDIDGLSTKGSDIGGKDDDDDASSVASVKVKVQPPFQPTSSPVHLQHRYMVWNSVGIIRCFNTEEENSIDVEFHDSSLHHNIYINNYLKHTMASLSQKALLLACEAQDDVPSKIVCVLLNSWDGTREWTTDLPAGEEVLATACADHWLVVATDLRNLRFFSIAGIQREVLSLAGPIVCLAANEDMLLVTYVHGSGLNFILFSVGRQSIDTLVLSQPVCLAPQSTLQWIGFTDEGTPCLADSAGILRIFSEEGYWQPLCDTQAQCAGKLDHYFIIGLSEKYKNIRCILCKGSHYPPTTPRPTVVEIPFKIPLCEPSSEKGNIEAEIWQTQITRSSLDNMCKKDPTYIKETEIAEKTLKQELMKLFAYACRNGLELRALDVCRLMNSNHLVQLAIKYATKYGKMQLVERIAETCNVANVEDTFETSEVASRFRTADRFSLQKKTTVVNEVKKVINAEIDPFASSQEESSQKGNMLLAVKERLNQPISVLSPFSQKKVNPFKKQTNSTAPSGDIGNKDSSSETKVSPAVSSIKVKQTGLWGKTPNYEGANSKKPTFIQWFAGQKTSLREECPDLDEKKLTYLAMKRYKEIFSKDSGKKSEENSQNAVEDSPQTVASGQNLEVKSALSNGANETCISNSDTSNMEVKKRKLNESEDLGSGSTSKLAKFAFKK